MRVAGVQFDIAWEEPAENFLRAAPLLERAAAAGAHLVALPEMFNTGFSMNAEEVPCCEATLLSCQFLRSR